MMQMASWLVEWHQITGWTERERERERSCTIELSDDTGIRELSTHNVYKLVTLSSASGPSLVRSLSTWQHYNHHQHLTHSIISSTLVQCTMLDRYSNARISVSCRVNSGQRWCFSVWQHCRNARQNRCRDLNNFSLGELGETTRTPRTTWMKTIQQNLKSKNLFLNEAIDMAQKRLLWRLMSTFGAMYS